MRRTDREITSATEIAAILDKSPILRLAMCDNNKPYVVPLNYAYELIGGVFTLYFHGAREGRKADILSRNSAVCFEADCSFEIREGAQACNWSAAYESVIGEGICELIAAPAEKARAMDLLMRRYGFEGKPEYPPAMLERTAVWRITAESVSGKSSRKSQ